MSDQPENECGKQPPRTVARTPKSDDPRPTLREAFLERPRHGDKFLAIFSLLLGSYLMLPLLAEADLAREAGALVMATTLLYTLKTSRVSAFQMRLALAWTLSWTVAAVLVAGETTSSGRAIVALAFALLIVATIPAILRRILDHEHQITYETISAALCVYVLVGLAFGAFYYALGTFSETPFLIDAAHPGVVLEAPTYFYFSFDSLTTVGSGAVAAVTDFGRTLASVEALIGQVLLVTLVTMLVARLLPSRG